ncbi:MAG: hypothetical protein ABGZ35_33370 [Planctomycetaceae bacterium]
MSEANNRTTIGIRRLTKQQEEMARVIGRELANVWFQDGTNRDTTTEHLSRDDQQFSSSDSPG